MFVKQIVVVLSFSKDHLNLMKLVYHHNQLLFDLMYLASHLLDYLLFVVLELERRGSSRATLRFALRLCTLVERFGIEPFPDFSAK